MITYEIPGRNKIDIKHLVLDYNGTIAIDGKLIQGVEDLILEISKYLEVHILTADTYGSVRKECSHLKAQIKTFPKENAGELKKDIVKKLGSSQCICVGNGYNDIPMVKEAILSIAVLEGEGTSGKLIGNTDIVARSIKEALEIILSKNKVKATLRS